MNKVCILFIVAILSLSACSRNYMEERITDRLQGQWIYEKAKYQEKAFCREDRLGDFENDQITFNNDGTFEIKNEVDSLYFSGIYSVERTDASNADNGVTSVWSIQLSYTDSISSQLYQELWNQLSINKKVMRYQYNEDGRPFYFKMRKQ